MRIVENFGALVFRATYRWTNENGQRRQRTGTVKMREEIWTELRRAARLWQETAARILEAKAIVGAPLELTDADFAEDSRAQAREAH